MIKKLVAFDFDGTLSNSPEPEVGKEIWKDKTGQEYPHKGWWGRPESLDTDVFDIHMYDSVLGLLRKETADPESYVIILTSRMEKLRPQLEKILIDNNIHVDNVDMKRSERTKGEKILRYIQQFPDLQEIDVYDDREIDIVSYKQIESQIPETIAFRIFLANQGQVRIMEVVNKLEGIIKEEIEKFHTNTLNTSMNLYHGADMDNLKDLLDSPQILPPEMKMRLPSNTGGHYIGLSTSTDVDKARRYSRGFGHNKVIYLQLLAGAKIIEIDTQGQGIDDVFTGDDLENYQKHGVDAVIELDDMAESEVRLLNSGHLKVIGII